MIKIYIFFYLQLYLERTSSRTALKIVSWFFPPMFRRRGRKIKCLGWNIVSCDFSSPEHLTWVHAVVSNAGPRQSLSWLFTGKKLFFLNTILKHWLAGIEGAKWACMFYFKMEDLKPTLTNETWAVGSPSCVLVPHHELSELVSRRHVMMVIMM